MSASSITSGPIPSPGITATFFGADDEESARRVADDEEAKARREAVRNRAYERDFLGKHRRIAKSLLQLVEDPDREHADVKAKGDVLVKGIESVREIRAEEERSQRVARRTSSGCAVTQPCSCCDAHC